MHFPTLALASAAALALVAPTSAQITLAPGDLSLELADPSSPFDFIFSLDIVADIVDPTLGDLSGYSLGFNLVAAPGNPSDGSVTLADITNDSQFAFAPDATLVTTLAPDGTSVTGDFTLASIATPVEGDILGTVDFAVLTGSTIGEFLLEIDDNATSFNLADGGVASFVAPANFIIPEPASAGLLLATGVLALRHRRSA
jgi:hypothetical protein